MKAYDKQLNHGVITDYPYAVKFTAVLNDINGVAIDETMEILFLKPSHKAFNVKSNHIATDMAVFGKLCEWFEKNTTIYCTAEVFTYAIKIQYLANS